jgi:hypothetical protein
MIEIKIEIEDIYDLKNKCWGQASSILDEIDDADLGDDLMSHLEDVFFDQQPTMTELNDYIAYDWEYIYEAIGMPTNDND